jgi:FG-GAP-like repeat/PPIC-type PPIASE domain/ASPIC and UnbV
MLKAAVRKTCLAGISLAAFSFAIFVPSGAQQASSSEPHPEEIGIIVAASAGDAARLLARLKAGADFAVLAREESTDATAADGGSMGKLDPSELRPELQEALRGLKPGEYSQIVPISSGYAILTVFPPRAHAEELNPERIQALIASGAVHYGIDVSGNEDENALFNEYPKPDGWNRDLHEVCSLRKEVHAAALQHMSAILAGAEGNPGQFSPADLIQGHGALSQLHAFVGDMDDAIAQAKDAYDIAVTSEPEEVPNLAETLGALYLHKSEMENGVYTDSGSIDLFPPANAKEASSHFAKEDDSRQAIVYFTKYVEAKPDDYEGKWLLNLTYRTLGEYPSGVPSAYLIPERVFESKQNPGRFPDVAKAAGLNVFSEAGGVLVDDFENNGRLDVVTSSMDVCEPMHYFHNNGDGTFTDRSVQAGLADQLGGLNMVAADYNNDGCMDILVLRGGWEFPVRRSLLRNNCDGTFTDVTDAAGLGGTVTRSQTAAWADIDNDGYLDLFIGNENTPSQLFRNKGDGTFEDISHKAGVDQIAYTKGVTAADYDNDGYMDFYVSNIGGPNFLYHNNHNGTFTDVAKQAGVQGPYYSFATWFFDYDNDGWPDLFVTSYFNSLDESVRSILGLPVHVETLKLYRNLHNGAFEDVTAKVGLDKVFMPMGSNFGDFDNDGYLDIYLGQGQPSFTGMLPHVLLRNEDGKRFVDVTAATGTGELHKGHGVAFADLERDGHEDIVAETGGAVPSDKHTMRVFQNPGNNNDWINVRLIGVKTNRSAVGAEIKVTVENGGGAERSIYRRVGETSSFGGNPLEQHIGLGPEAKITALDVWWPTTNMRQHFTDVEKDQFLSITEFATKVVKLNRPVCRLGGAASLSAK